MNKEIWSGVGIALIVVILALGYKASETLQALTDAAKATRETAQSVKAVAPAFTETLTQATNTLQSVQTTIDRTQPVLAHLDSMVTGLNAKCVPGPCGLIPDAAKTLNTVRGTFGQIEIAAKHENQNLTTLDSQEATLFNDLHNTIGAMPLVIQQYGDAATSLNGWLKSKQLKEMADNSVSMTESGKGILSDSAGQIHTWTHPSKKKLTFWSATMAAGDYLRHFMPPIF